MGRLINARHYSPLSTDWRSAQACGYIRHFGEPADTGRELATI